MSDRDPADEPDPLNLPHTSAASAAPEHEAPAIAIERRGERGYEYVNEERAISMPSFDRAGPVFARHPWPEAVFLQGGADGIVVGPSGSYRTAFVEVSADELGFVRGEGKTLEDAEDDCWAKAQRIWSCAGPAGHAWEARGYSNGGGVCKHCGAFGAKAFTPEQLGLFCAICSVPTYWHEEEGKFYCQEHVPHHEHGVCYCKACSAKLRRYSMEDLLKSER